MQKVNEIAVKNTVQVKVSCELNEEVVSQNFAIIMECLKELQSNQDELKQSFKGLDRNYKLLTSQLNNTNNSQNNQQHSTQHAQIQLPSHTLDNQKQLEDMIRQLQNKTNKHDQSIVSNIKDITVLQKEILELKELLKNNSQNEIHSKTGTENKIENESLSNIHKEIITNKDNIEKLFDMIKQLKHQNSNLKESINQINQNKGEEKEVIEVDKTHNEGNVNANETGNWQKQLSDLRSKISALEKKLNNQQSKLDSHSESLECHSEKLEHLTKQNQNLNSEIQKLKDILKSISQNLKANNSSQKTNTDRVDDLRLKGKNYDKEIEYLQQQIDDLKLRLGEVERERINSKTSIEGNPKNDYKGSYTQTKFHTKDDDRLRELEKRLDYLEKLIQKQNTGEDSKSNQEKLPLIKRAKLGNRDRDSSFYDRSSHKKDMLDMKNQIQNWLNNYLANMKSRDNFEELELRFQELKNSLNKKADHEGMKKGLAFLEAKINQLYLFLTEPDSEDAMIVRKGFNCLSCSKKVEHLRGKLGPHVNWNNMTTTNYSPPKVGYSRNMPESGQKDDDL